MKNVIQQVQELQNTLEARNNIIEAIKTLLTGKTKKAGKRGRPKGVKNKKKTVAKKATAKTIKVKAEAHKNGANQEVTA